MGARERYEVPDWVVEDYNSRVPKEDQLPLPVADEYDSEEDKQRYNRHPVYTEKRSDKEIAEAKAWEDSERKAKYIVIFTVLLIELLILYFCPSLLLLLCIVLCIYTFLFT